MYFMLQVSQSVRVHFYMKKFVFMYFIYENYTCSCVCLHVFMCVCLYAGKSVQAHIYSNSNETTDE